MKKRKRRYYDSYDSIKSTQWKTRKRMPVVHDYEVDDLFLNCRDRHLNKRRRSRIGHVEKANELD